MIWLCARFHKKHVFYSKTAPKVSAVLEDFRNFEHRLKWQIHLRNVQTRSPSIRVKAAKHVTPFHGVTDPEVKCWLAAFRSYLLNGARKAVKIARYRRLTNMCGITRLALKVLKEGPWAATPTDKDGGFCNLTEDCPSAGAHQYVIEEVVHRDPASHRRKRIM